MEEDHTYCVNCKRDIPSLNFVMHSVHCSRNITLCTLCEEPVPRSEMDAHIAEFHSLKECELCGEKLDASQLQAHKTDSCPLRRISCLICELELAASQIAEHENYCGSRTEVCDECGENVMLKYKKLHLESNHGFFKLDDEPGPAPSWQSSERRVVNGTFNNDLRSQRKVPNTAAFFLPQPVSPSPSTSKRTNDMPQVNSVPPPHASKALHKVTIGGDVDRPLRNYPPGDHIDSDVAALFSDSLHLTKPPSRRSSLSTDHSSYSGEEDLVALPCEFCQALVPANQLILHQTACRPDLTRFSGLLSNAASTLNPMSSGDTSSLLSKHAKISSNTSGYKIHNDLTVPPSPLEDFTSSEIDDTKLPCEFCHKSFSVTTLYDHQAQCIQAWPVDHSVIGGRPAADILPQNILNKTKLSDGGKNLDVQPPTFSKLLKDDHRTNALQYSRLPIERKPEDRSHRIFRPHPLESEWLLPVQHGINVMPLTSPNAYQPPAGLQQLEANDGRRELLEKAKQMDQIKEHLAKRKECAQRNHIIPVMPSPGVNRLRQPNNYPNPPNGSQNTASYHLPSTSYLNRSGGRGGRTTGAIPKQKAGTGKTPITF